VKVIITGQGIEGGVINIPLHFTIFATIVEDFDREPIPVAFDALEVVIYHAEKREIKPIPTLKERRPGVVDVTYTLPETGPYNIIVNVLSDDTYSTPFLAHGIEKPVKEKKEKAPKLDLHKEGKHKESDEDSKGHKKDKKDKKHHKEGKHKDSEEDSKGHKKHYKDSDEDSKGHKKDHKDKKDTKHHKEGKHKDSDEDSKGHKKHHKDSDEDSKGHKKHHKEGKHKDSDEDSKGHKKHKDAKSPKSPKDKKHHKEGISAEEPEESYTVTLDFGHGPTKTNISLHGYGVIGGVFTGKSVQFGIRITDSQKQPITVSDNDIAVTLTDEHNSHIETHITFVSPGAFSVRYHPEKAGAYFLNVLLKGHPILQNPHKILFKTSSKPEQPQYHQELHATEPQHHQELHKAQPHGRIGTSHRPKGDIKGLVPSLPAFCPVSFTVATDGEELEVTVVDSEGDEHPVVLYDDQYGIQNAVFIPSKAPATFSVYVVLGGEPIKGSPFSVDVFPITAKLTGNDLRGTVSLRGRPAKFQLDVVDHNNKNVSIPNTGLVVRTKGPDRTRPKIHSSSQPGHYDITFSPKKSGEYAFDVYLFDECISQKTRRGHFTVLPHVRPVVLEYPLIAPAFIPFTFDLPLISEDDQPIAVDPADLQVIISNVDYHSESIRANVERGPSGKFHISFVPHSTGRHVISPLVDNNPLLEDLIPFLVCGDINYRYCTVEDLPREVSGNNVTFKLVVRDTNRVVIPTIDEPQSFRISAIPFINNVLVHDKAEVLHLESSSKHFIHWNPRLSAPYQIHAYFGDEELSNVPLNVSVKLPAHGKNSNMWMEKYTVVTATVEVFANETDRKYVGGDNVTIVVSSEDGDVYPHEVKDNGDGTYSVSFRHDPGKSGKFIIRGFVDGEETKNSPCFFNYAH
jgi:hypothetical protein